MKKINSPQSKNRDPVFSSLTYSDFKKGKGLMRLIKVKRLDVSWGMLVCAFLLTSGIFAEPLNLLKNGDFSSAANNWTLNTWGDCKAKGSVINGEYRIAISAIDTLIYDVQLVQAGLNLKKGMDYQVTFDAHAVANRMLQVNVEMADSPWTSYLANFQQFNLTPAKQRFTFVFTMNADPDTNGRIGFNVGNKIDTVYLDSISVSPFEPTAVRCPQLLSEGKTVNICICKSYADIQFKSSANGNAYLKIYDLSGKVIKNAVRSITADQLCKYRFDLSGVANGCYVLSVTCGGECFKRTKFVLRNGDGSSALQ